MIFATKYLNPGSCPAITKLLKLSLKLLDYTGISIDEITMVIVIDDDVTAGRKRRNTDVQTMQELICTQVIASLQKFHLFPVNTSVKCVGHLLKVIKAYTLITDRPIYCEHLLQLMTSMTAMDYSEMECTVTHVYDYGFVQQVWLVATDSWHLPTCTGNRSWCNCRCKQKILDRSHQL